MLIKIFPNEHQLLEESKDHQVTFSNACLVSLIPRTVKSIDIKLGGMGRVEGML